LAGEEVDMPIFFFIDKDFLDDPTMRDIDDVVLSYTFFKYADLPHASYLPTLITLTTRARRNEQGHLEPDADQATVNESMGWSEYEHAERSTSRPTQ
jgi:cytochrome c oxidase assembly protein subunit 11